MNSRYASEPETTLAAAPPAHGAAMIAEWFSREVLPELRQQIYMRVYESVQVLPLS